MLINIKGKNIEVSDALSSYVNKKVQKLDKYFHDLKEAVVSLSVHRGMHVVEVQLEGDGVMIRAEERRGNDMYGSIDQVVEKLESRIQKFKGKFYGKATEEGPKERAIAKDELRTEAFGPEGEEVEVEGEPAVVRTKRFAMKPMTPEEAAQRMELLHHTFYVFRSSKTEEVNVVYKRDDGDYGLIEPA